MNKKTNEILRQMQIDDVVLENSSELNLKYDSFFDCLVNDKFFIAKICKNKENNMIYKNALSENGVIKFELVKEKILIINCNNHKSIFPLNQFLQILKDIGALNYNLFLKSNDECLLFEVEGDINYILTPF